MIRDEYERGRVNMAYITDLKANTTGDKVKIFIDGESFGTISSDTVIRYGLKPGMEIDITELDKIVGDSDKDLATAYILNYLTKYTATEKKARDMMKKKGFSSASIEYAIKKAKDYRYIDDRSFAERYIERKLSNSGMSKIKSELAMHGISSKIISELVSEIEEDDIIEGALNVSRRWWNTRDIFDRSDKDKFVRYMSSKGFNWSVTEKCINIIKAEETEALNDEEE